MAWMAGAGIREISKGVAAHLLFQGKEVVGRVRRQFHPVIVKFFFLHQAAKVDPVWGEIPLHLFGKSRMGGPIR